jgi:hypothetical protein
MMVKGFEVWKVAVRLLPKRFDTTKTRSGPFRALPHEWINSS